jgi:ADP-ribosylglycohydrolase
LGSGCENSPGPLEVVPERPWILTDDTQLTLATCDAIADAGCVDPQTIAERFADLWRQGRVHGAGASVVKALTELSVGGHWATVGRKGEMAAGNGAAMRIAPLAFAVDPNEPDARTVIRDVCRITHHSDEAYCGALAVVWAVRLVFLDQWPPETSLLSLIARRLPDCNVRDRLRELDARGVTVAEAADRFGAGGHVVQSVPLAILAASRCRAVGFGRILSEVVAVGGDADTNASIAGQIAGTETRYAGLPPEAVQRLPDRGWVLDVASRFALSSAVTGRR